MPWETGSFGGLFVPSFAGTLFLVKRTTRVCFLVAGRRRGMRWAARRRDAWRRAWRACKARWTTRARRPRRRRRSRVLFWRRYARRRSRRARGARRCGGGFGGRSRVLPPPALAEAPPMLLPRSSQWRHPLDLGTSAGLAPDPDDDLLPRESRLSREFLDRRSTTGDTRGDPRAHAARTAADGPGGGASSSTAPSMTIATVPSRAAADGAAAARG